MMVHLNPKILYKIEITSKELRCILQALGEAAGGTAKILRKELVEKRIKCQEEIIKTFKASIEIECELAEIKSKNESVEEYEFTSVNGNAKSVKEIK